MSEPENIMELIKEIHVDVRYVRDRVDDLSKSVYDHESRISVLEAYRRMEEKIDRMRRSFRHFIVIAAIGLVTVLVSVIFHILL